MYIEDPTRENGGRDHSISLQRQTISQEFDLLQDDISNLYSTLYILLKNKSPIVDTTEEYQKLVTMYQDTQKWMTQALEVILHISHITLFYKRSLTKSVIFEKSTDY